MNEKEFKAFMEEQRELTMDEMKELSSAVAGAKNKATAQKYFGELLGKICYAGEFAFSVHALVYTNGKKLTKTDQKRFEQGEIQSVRANWDFGTVIEKETGNTYVPIFTHEKEYGPAEALAAAGLTPVKFCSGVLMEILASGDLGVMLNPHTDRIRIEHPAVELILKTMIENVEKMRQ